MGVAGLALAGALSAWANCAMLYAMLHRRGHFTIEPDLLGRIGRILLSAAAMGGVIWFLARLWRGLLRRRRNRTHIKHYRAGRRGCDRLFRPRLADRRD
jgi:peptidoglycan biosynthesis protein MviN/MurJ (putative lipid II flippase)